MLAEAAHAAIHGWPDVIVPKQRGRKRGIGNFESSTAKKARVGQYQPDTSDIIAKALKRAERAEKQRLAQAALQAAIERQNSYVCVLCPDPAKETLVKLANAPTALLATDPKRRAGHAHKICVMFTPATWIAKDENGEERVYGFEGVEPARWSLVSTYLFDQSISLSNVLEMPTVSGEVRQ